MRRSNPLHDGWRLLLGAEARGRLGTSDASLPATVPGCVHVDLLAAGLIPDPLVDRHEDEVQWIGGVGWTYVLTFDADHEVDAAERVDIVFDGLDTLATVTLNGVVLGRTENQHRTYCFDVTTAIRAGANTLEVAFAPAAVVAEDRRRHDGDRPNAYGQPYNYVRKMAANFGWDWGPRLVTAGIWRAVHIERWRTSRLAAVRVHAGVRTDAPRPGEGGDLAVDVEVAHAADGTDRSLRLEVTVRDPDGGLVARRTAGLPPDATTATVTTTVDDIRRWCPRGWGEAALYDVVVTLAEGDHVLDRVTRRVGFCSVSLDTAPDHDGAAFAFVVNGRRVWIRGFNWIPDDCFPSRVTPTRLAARLDEAAAANANLLRVWGGGVYESDAFYDECDRRGMLVWQDFAFACAAYPEELLVAEVRAEAIDNVGRLQTHPSLLVWCGNNENLMGFADWGWRDQLAGRSWGEGFYRTLLPAIVGELDPHRPYIDGSPTSLDPARHPNDDRYGAVHLWDVWNDHDYHHYRSHAPRFVAEFGYQAPATYPTLRRALAGRPLDRADPALAHHQKAFDGEAKLDRWLQAHFGPVPDADDWLYLTQLNQADAVTVGVGHFRSLHERCAGVIWWQLNDCWPAVSWAVLDSEGRRKPAWYAARRAFADRTLIAAPAADGVQLTLVNDTAERWDDTLRVVALDADSAPAGEHVEQVHVEAHGATRVDLPAACGPGGASGVVVLVATVGGRRAVHAVAERPSSPPHWEVDVVAAPEGVEVVVTARTTVRDLCCFAERLDPGAVVDDQCVTLLAGESHRFAVRTHDVDLARWRDAVLSAPSLVLRARGDRPAAPTDPSGPTTYHRAW